LKNDIIELKIKKEPENGGFCK